MGSRLCPSLFSCSNTICVRTERVMSSPLASWMTTVLAPLHHGGEVVVGHIGAGGSVIETPVGILLDRDRRVRRGHLRYLVSPTRQHRPLFWRASRACA